MHKNATPSARNLSSLPFARLQERSTADKDHGSASPEAFSSPVHLSQPSSRQNSRTSSPFTFIQPARPPNAAGQGDVGGPETREERLPDPESFDNEGEDLNEWNNEQWDEADEEDDMPSDLRPSMERHRSSQPLLSNDHPGYDSPIRPRGVSQHSTLYERDPDSQARDATKRRYMLASVFLVLSLITFAVQTETAVYITKELHWEKSYCMLYFTHGSWSLLWPFQLLILRLEKWHLPWNVFWKRHMAQIRQTAQMVQHRTLHLTTRQAERSPWRYMFRITALVTCALTVAGISWYVAVKLTTASDLSAIYNCSAFFAYAFSICLLRETLRVSKVLAVGIAIIGVLVVSYGGEVAAKHGNKSGGGAGGPSHDDSHANDVGKRLLGNIIMGVGSVLYGLYEVVYKRVACPPDECSPGRGAIFANTFASMIGAFTLSILWIPLPILHFLDIERFEFPHGEQAWMLAISVLANAIFSGSFLVLISLTSPVLSSVAALLTIFIVAIIDQLLPPPLYAPLTGASIVGGVLIIVAFFVLSWATYREMDQERRKKMETYVDESDAESTV